MRNIFFFICFIDLFLKVLQNTFKENAVQVLETKEPWQQSDGFQTKKLGLTAQFVFFFEICTFLCNLRLIALQTKLLGNTCIFLLLNELVIKYRVLEIVLTFISSCACYLAVLLVLDSVKSLYCLKFCKRREKCYKMLQKHEVFIAFLRDMKWHAFLFLWVKKALHSRI